MDKNLYDLPPEEAKDIPQVAYSLDQALEALWSDRHFLLEGGVFSEDMLSAYIECKMGIGPRVCVISKSVYCSNYSACLSLAKYYAFSLKCAHRYNLSKHLLATLISQNTPENLSMPAHKPYGTQAYAKPWSV